MPRTFVAEAYVVSGKLFGTRRAPNLGALGFTNAALLSLRYQKLIGCLPGLGDCLGATVIVGVRYLFSGAETQSDWSAGAIPFSSEASYQPKRRYPN